ncbi:hypothetical protein RI844_02525 [Thalassotalea fonticola]|uniref:Cadherin domain-containing protein n=1 Tax=Thalassotalea fonticola TaxID=3065649 RepID=A0ABZ0GQA2_9GAMM|nr:hypothetical protein RI844_02525 [Colwelliaceae bacterium S1-1]
MSTKLTHKYNRLATALLLLAPMYAVNAAAPVFIENSVLNNELEFLFNPNTGNSEHLSMAINSQNSIYTSYQNAAASVDIVNVAQFTQGQVTDLGEQSSVATANTYSQLRVNPVDDSLVLAFVENGNLVVRTSADGQAWQQAATTAVTASSKSVKMEIDSQGIAYVMHTGSDNMTTVFKLDADSLNIIYGPIATKSNNSFTVAADLAINSKDQLYFLYRDFTTGFASRNKTLLVSWDENDVLQPVLVTSGAPTAAYMKAKFDRADNLHLFNVGYTSAAGGAVYKLDGTDVSDTTWQQVGDKNFGFTLAEGHDASPTTGAGSPVLDLAFDSNDVPYVAFQQLNNATASKKHAQLASLVDDVWREISYDLSTVTKTDSNPDNANHNFLDIAIDNYDRPLLMLRSSGTGHNSWGYTLRANLAASDETIAFSVNEGSVSVGQITADDADSDAITLTLSGADADLFDIEQMTGAISFKKIVKISDADQVFDVTVNATAAEETTSAAVQITLINDASNDLPDADNDGVPDDEDAFPNDPTETVDSDGDGVGDNSDFYPNDPTRTESEDLDDDGLENDVDDDDDGDGVLDIYDAFPLDPLESKDSDGDGFGDNGDAFPNDPTEHLDSDGDGFGDNIDPNPLDENDLTAPAFAEDIAAIVVPAMGLLTNVEQAILAANIVASDLFDGDIAAKIESEELLFTSGKHIVEMSATDAAGNKSVKDITLDIPPIFSVSQSLTTTAGAALSIPVSLSGIAANYPVDISYSVIGPVTIGAGVITFDEDNDQTSLSLSVDESAVDGDEILVSFETSANAVVHGNTQVKVVVDNENNAPLLALETRQADQSVSVVSPTQGVVTITANINDLNVDDTHAVSFDVIGAEFVDLMLDDNHRTFEFDPALLESGSYQVKVSVIEANTPELLETTIYRNIIVDSELTEIQVDSDQDGIVDSLDSDNTPSRLPIADKQQPLQVSTGLALALGDIALASDDARDASIAADAIETDYHFTPISTIINFIVNGLSEKGSSVAIVLPLAQEETILEGSVYRKYSPAKGWFNFVEDESNSLASAAKDAVGNCPAPYAASYYQADGVTANGLITGFDCIQLTIADGGANDGDELSNGTIADPGVLAIEHENNLPEILAYDAAAISGQLAVLEASADDADFDQIQFNWVQLTGPTVVIDDADLPAISFTAPEVDSVTELIFEVTADDGRDVVSSIVTLTVTVVDTNPDEDLHRHSGSFGWLMLMFGGLLIGRRKNYP